MACITLFIERTTAVIFVHRCKHSYGTRPTIFSSSSLARTSPVLPSCFNAKIRSCNINTVYSKFKKERFCEEVVAVKKIPCVEDSSRKSSFRKLVLSALVLWQNGTHLLMKGFALGVLGNFKFILIFLLLSRVLCSDIRQYNYVARYGIRSIVRCQLRGPEIQRSGCNYAQQF